MYDSNICGEKICEVNPENRDTHPVSLSRLAGESYLASNFLMKRIASDCYFPGNFKITDVQPR